MKRLLVAALAAVFWVGVASAGSGTRYSGVTSMTFQNGVAPTSGYAGCADTYINSTNNTNNYGASDSMSVASSSATSGQSNILISFDISALPDSAVITRAELWLYQVAPSGVTVTAEDLQVFRLYNVWTEGSGGAAGSVSDASWNNRVTATSWSSFGALGRANPFVRSGVATADSSTVVTSRYGADSLSVFGSDTPTSIESCSPVKQGNTAAKRLGWVVWDLTHQVDLWHVGANNNNGVTIQNPGGSSTYTVSFYSSHYTGYLLRRPKLVVYYLDPTSGTSSGGRRVIGNGAGAIH